MLKYKKTKLMIKNGENKNFKYFKNKLKYFHNSSILYL